MENAIHSRRDFLRLGAGAAGVLPSCQAVGVEQEAVVRPREIDDLLVNPGMGNESFWFFQGDRISFDRELDNFPPCSIAYFRYYWNELEREKDRYDFEEIDMLLAKARRRGQDLTLRFMGFNFGKRYPDYLVKKVKGYDVQVRPHRYATQPVPAWCPDFNDPYFLERLEAFLEAFGKRYDGHPEMIRLDIGSIGRWGEWHTSNTAPMPSEKTAFQVIDMHLKYWPRTPLCMLIGYVPGLRYAVNHGAGWRADSLGDYGKDPSKNWSHMRNMYPQNLDAAHAHDAWKRGPVTFEVAALPEVDAHIEKGGGWDAMWNQALAWHGSSVNLRALPVPDRAVEPLHRFLTRCGYRLVLRSLSHPAQVRRGQAFTVKLEFENAGVAPPYKDYVLAARLRRERWEVVQDSTAKLTAWLPGKHLAAVEVQVPPEAGTGNYEISVGVLDPYYREAEIRLAIEGRAPDGWYPLSSVEVMTA